MMDKVQGVNFIKLQTQESVTGLNTKQKRISQRISKQINLQKRISAQHRSRQVSANELGQSGKSKVESIDDSQVLHDLTMFKDYEEFEVSFEVDEQMADEGKYWIKV